MVNQIAVFLENRKGRLIKLTKVLADQNIDLVALSIADTKDFGIVRMLTSDNKKAVQALKTAGFTVTSSDLIALEVEDVPGGLHKVLEKIEQVDDVDIEYLYSFAHTKQGKAIILFKTENTNKVVESLKQMKDIKLFTQTII